MPYFTVTIRQQVEAEYPIFADCAEEAQRIVASLVAQDAVPPPSSIAVRTEPRVSAVACAECDRETCLRIAHGPLEPDAAALLLEGDSDLVSAASPHLMARAARVSLSKTSRSGLTPSKRYGRS